MARQASASPHLPADPGGNAAVALILSGAPKDLRICFIQRAERQGDYWSGQMAFPGGRASPQDPHLRAVAERETQEEVGLELCKAECLGKLSALSIRRKGFKTGGMLRPFVYYLEADSPRLQPNEEVAAAYWISLDHLWNPVHCTTVEVERKKEPITFAGIRYGGNVIWGLTYRILEQFAEVVDIPLPCSRE